MGWKEDRDFGETAAHSLADPGEDEGREKALVQRSTGY